MARTHDAGPQLDRPGQKPLLQGHRKPGGVRPADAPGGEATPGGETPPDRSAQPAEDLASSANDAEATRGKATKSPADVATRPHLEGSEQGPA
jgi:hypothetical protein